MSSEPSSVLCSNSYCHDKNERQENINFACLTKSQKDNKSKTKTKKQKKKGTKEQLPESYFKYLWARSLHCKVIEATNDALLNLKA